MGVAIDATGTKLSGSVAATTFDFTGITVGTASTLVAFLDLEILAGGFSGLTMVWDPVGANQSLAQIRGNATTTNSARAELWGLVSPVAGNKILRVTWVTAHKYAFDAISLTGADLTGGVTTFANANSATGSGTTTSVTITSAANNMVVATHAADVTCSATNNTTIFIDSSGVAGAANRAAGAASVAMTATIGSDDWVAIGCNVVAAAAAAGQVPYTPWPQLGPTLAMKHRGFSGWTPLRDHRTRPGRRLLVRDAGLILPIKRAA